MTNATDSPEATVRNYDAVRASLDSISTSSDKVASSLTKTFANAVASGKSFDQTLQTIIQSLSKMALNAALQPVTQGLSAGLQSLIGGLGAGLTGAAGGGVAAAGIPAFASGGVVAQPTFFGTPGGLGLAGEGGAEAILPLTRGPGGQLGVMASGGGGASTENVNISTPDVNSFQRSQVQVTGALARAVQRGQRGL
jgi:phage-related minor tail protein